jgi:hypothetical protein
MANPLFSRLYARAAQTLDWSVGWTKLPPYAGVFTLVGMRITLRRRNLYDTGVVDLAGRPTQVTQPTAAAQPSAGSTMEQVAPEAQAARGAGYLTARTADGSYNDLHTPAMGAAGQRFGRNVPLNQVYPEPASTILTPNPRTVSRELLTRDTFIPATSLNLLAAAWLQFQVHDWLSHGKNQKEDPYLVPLADDDPWPQHPMRILRTRRDPTRTARDATRPPTYTNDATHWWDGSQIYGSDAATQARVRAGEGGKLALGSDGLLPLDPTSGVDVTGVNGNWWLGLSLLHTLFTLEHNAICDRLRAEYPAWSDDDLFDKARLVNAALMAKIHTVEWTPGILSHPTMRIAMRGDWWGVAMEQLHRIFGRLSKSDLISGAPGSDTDHFGVPYSITEEFVSVYRMHPLIPDEFTFRSVAGDAVLEQRLFPAVADSHAREAMTAVSMLNALYTFGTSNPGAITLHNHPRFLQRREEPDGTIDDLAAIDILRSRERGVPRYNAFRAAMHRPRLTTFEQLSDNPRWVEELRRVYNDDIDSVDISVGLFAEPLPPGFGFSDTALRMFLLMAPRRIKSDRFFTTDFTPRVYTPVGMRWIDDNGLSDVLLRHFPALAPALRGVANPFAPWARIPGGSV